MSDLQQVILTTPITYEHIEDRYDGVMKQFRHTVTDSGQKVDLKEAEIADYAAHLHASQAQVQALLDQNYKVIAWVPLEGGKRVLLIMARTEETPYQPGLRDIVRGPHRD